MRVQQLFLTEAIEADQALARGEILGPLHGVPVTIKDSLDTQGIISTWGTSGRKFFHSRTGCYLPIT
jgi:amidase